MRDNNPLIIPKTTAIIRKEIVSFINIGFKDKL